MVEILLLFINLHILMVFLRRVANYILPKTLKNSIVAQYRIAWIAQDLDAGLWLKVLLQDGTLPSMVQFLVLTK